jgi:hypothetical protein
MPPAVFHGAPPLPPKSPSGRRVGGGSRPPAAASVPVGRWGRPWRRGGFLPACPAAPAVRGAAGGHVTSGHGRGNLIDPAVKPTGSLVT